MIIKAKTQISLMMVCILLGFILTYQFKSTLKSTTKTKNRGFTDIGRQIIDLKEQKNNLSKKYEALQKKVNDYEKAAAGQNYQVKAVRNDIVKFRQLAGVTDVRGEGIVITITPKEDIFSREIFPVSSDEIVFIINDLNSAGAEAVSVNDERYIINTQIKDVKNNIKINDSEFDGTKAFIIKAIGNPDSLSGVFKLPDNIIDDIRSTGTQVDINEKEDITILKFNQTIDYKYMKS